MAWTKNVYAPLHHLPFSMLSVHNLFLSEPYLCTLKYFSERIVLGHSALARLPSCLNFKTLTDKSMNFSSEKVYLHHYLSRRCRWTTVSAILFSQNRLCSILLKRILLHGSAMFCIWTTGSCLNFKNLQDETSFRGKVYVHSFHLTGGCASTQRSLLHGCWGTSGRILYWYYIYIYIDVVM